MKTGEAGQTVVTDQLQTANPRVWAGGDVTGHPEFVYVAARHGTIVAENAFTDANTSVDYTDAPGDVHRSRHRRGRDDREGGHRGRDPLRLPRPATGVRAPCAGEPGHAGSSRWSPTPTPARSSGLTAVAKDAGELAAAGVHILGKTIAEVADAWAPYLTNGRRHPHRRQGLHHRRLEAVLLRLTAHSPQ